MEILKQNNVRIFYFNWKNSTNDKAISAVKELKRVYSEYNPKDLFVLIDASGSRAEPDAIKQLGDLTQKKRAKAIAIVGLNEIQKLIAYKIRPDIYICDSKVQAKEWLTKQYNTIRVAS